MAEIAFGRSVCGDLEAAERREWLVTNGLGGFASGTVAGSLTRRYHGFLFAATPPLRRTLLLAKIDEDADYAGQRFALATNRWSGGAIAPEGYVRVERFELDGTRPVWHFALADALLEKTIWMEHGANATYVRYAHVRGSGPIDLSLRVIANYRDLHGQTRANGWQMNVTPVASGIRVEAFPSAAPYYVLGERAKLDPAHEWYYGYRLEMEAERGLDAVEDHLCVAVARLRLEAGESCALVACDVELAALDAAASLARARARDASLLSRWERDRPEASAAPGWVRQCVLAADAFLVESPGEAGLGPSSLIAGYPWFGAWSRDAMIALPGLTLATGRPEIAARVLRAFAAFLNDGMLPNYFPDGGEAPPYNTVDGALWFVEAVAAYVRATNDLDLLRELFPALETIVRAYRHGTRYGIGVDPADGLLRAGEAGVQLTWMDAKVGERVITPRSGKPVEICALWYDALRQLAELAPPAGHAAEPFAALAERARVGFARFWNANAGYCYDVLDGPQGADARLRPNQLFAVSLRFSPLDEARRRSVVAACGRRLLAGAGLRSLDPSDPAYVGRYLGPPAQRDAAYHQGTSWRWLLGPFATAYARAYGDATGARRFLDACADAMRDSGLGTLGEITDGDAPFHPRGAIAQAWSIGEALRAYDALARPAAAGATFA